MAYLTAVFRRVKRRNRAIDAIAALVVLVALLVPLVASSAATDPNLLRNPSLESATDGVPDCWLFGGYGTNDFAWAPTRDAHSGARAERLDLTALVSGDRKLVSRQYGGDLCWPAATPGHRYLVTAWYKSTAPPTLFAYYRTSSGSWKYWTQSGQFASSSSWTQARWTTPAAPSEAQYLSVGLGLLAVGSLTADDFGLADAADATPPAVSLTAPANGASVTGTVTLSASASDDVGIDHVDFLVDGQTVGSDTATPSSFAWNSQTVADGAHSVAARAVDSSGNATTSSAASVTVTNSPASTASPSYFGMQPSARCIGVTYGSGCAVATGLPRSDAYCAGAVARNAWEPRPDNFVANHTIVAPPYGWATDSYWAGWMHNLSLVDGNFTGTTTEIIQWAACKWGLDEDTLRADAAQESWWHQNDLGDVCGPVGKASYGLMQIKNSHCDGTIDQGGFPLSEQSTALNVDFYGAKMRSCYDGVFNGGSWLYGGQTVAEIAAVHSWDYVKWGCIGYWYSGSWNPTQKYVRQVKQILANRTWTKSGF